MQACIIRQQSLILLRKAEHPASAFIVFHQQRRA
jgi:hypothetical protein